jgi:hypothetical protein
MAYLKDFDLFVEDLNRQQMLSEWTKLKDKLFRAMHLIMDNLFCKKLINEKQQKSYFKTG